MTAPPLPSPGALVAMTCPFRASPVAYLGLTLPRLTAFVVTLIQGYGSLCLIPGLLPRRAIASDTPHIFAADIGLMRGPILARLLPSTHERSRP
ncbi:hypothetical protein RGQ15_15025 [Paracoccus sp. MBLB3053]|uniref:Uncharacterized protein n=1 Tax=Paracoccus aurantius TaxID=3073814 RepID=A0ABU2HV04_9RHOB|nr:hypothetical protein [Paracoccus sp. MBLB3053]MDS9468877.1 hypothetical protein [Paracoccus sp. MBLB3053]